MLLEHINNFCDIIHGTIQVSCIEKMIIATPEFNRLHKIMQSSTLYLTFPCNNVKRFEHSIGTMHIAGKIFYHCISNSRKDVLDEFFNEAGKRIDEIITQDFCKNNLKILDHEYIREKGLLKNRGCIKSLPHEAFLNTHIPYNLVQYAKEAAEAVKDAESRFNKKSCDETKEAVKVARENECKASGRIFDYLVTFEAVRIVGLLHDVGHLPYSHALEKSLQNIYYLLFNKTSRDDKEAKYINFLSKEFHFDKAPVEIHEKIGQVITDSIFEGIRDEWANTTADSDRPIYAIGLLAFEMVKRILGEGDNPKESGNKGEEQILFYTSLHEIVAGTFDADRLDYICRDTCASLYNKHILDYNCLINSLIFIKHENNFRIAIPLKYISDIESFLNKRWEIHAKINYHNRAAKMYMLLIQSVTELGLKELSSETIGQIQQQTDEEPDYIIQNNISGIWKTLYTLPEEASYKYFAYRLMQLDDGWLDSVIRKAYFLEKNKEVRDKDQKLEDKLEELISNRKIFYSLMKMDHDFMRIDNKIRTYFFTNEMYNKCISFAKELDSRQVSLNYKPKSDEVIISNNLPQKTVNKLNDLKQHNDTLGSFNGFFFRIILKAIKELGWEKTEMELYEPLKKAIQDTDINIRDSFVVPIPAKTGIRNVWFYKGNGCEKVECHELSKVSNIDKKLNLNCDCLPGFYIYYSLKSGTLSEDTINKLYDNIAKETAKTLLNNIYEGLKENEKTFFS